MENSSKRGLKILYGFLALLLVLLSVPTQSLAYAQKAWADGRLECYAIFYETSANTCTLVFQNDPTPSGGDGLGRVITVTPLGEGEFYAGYFGTGCLVTAAYALPNTRCMQASSISFQNCSGLETVDLSGLEVTNLVDAGHMFEGCGNLRRVNLSGFDTSRVTNMSAMFDRCYNLESLDLFGLDTSRVTDMEGMFNGCFKLKSLDLSSFDTSKVQNMSLMFSQCRALEFLDASSFDTSRTREMGCMFNGCANLRSLDIAGFDTSMVEDMSGMFAGDSCLEQLDVSGFDTSSVSGMCQMFGYCSSLGVLDVSHFDTSKVTDMSYMFENCESLKSLDVSSFKTSNVQQMSYMFSNCSSLSSIDISGFDVSTASGGGTGRNLLKGLFEGCLSLKRVGLPKLTSMMIADNLPVPDPDYIPEATGKWVAPDGYAYALKDLPPNVGGIYRAETVSEPGKKKVPTGISSARSISGGSLSLSPSSFVYDGKVKRPTNIIVKVGGKALRQNIDFVVTCKGGKAVGAYRVAVKGCGAYKGTLEATYRVIPKGVSAIKISKAKKGFTVSWKTLSRSARSQIDGYQVRYSTNKSMKSAKTATAKGAAKRSVKVSKVKGGKTYYVQVRSYKKVSGKAYCSKWSKAKAVKTGK